MTRTLYNRIKSPLLACVLAHATAVTGISDVNCPAGPFKLHGFAVNRSAVDQGVARPYFIVVCVLCHSDPWALQSDGTERAAPGTVSRMSCVPEHVTS